MLDRFLGFESLDDSRIYEELAVGKHASVHALAILVAFLLLDRVDGEAAQLGAELVIHPERVLLRNRLLDSLLALGQ